MVTDHAALTSWMRSTWPLAPAAGRREPGGVAAGVGRNTLSVKLASCELASAATRIAYCVFFCALNVSDALPSSSVCAHATGCSCERTSLYTSTVPSSLPPAATSTAIRSALAVCRVYHTELTVPGAQFDGASPGTVVAPTVVPSTLAGSAPSACALATSSFAGAVGAALGAASAAAANIAAATATSVRAAARINLTMTAA